MPESVPKLKLYPQKILVLNLISQHLFAIDENKPFIIIFSNNIFYGLHYTSKKSLCMD